MSEEGMSNTATEQIPSLLRKEKNKRPITATIPDMPENREFIEKIIEIKKYNAETLLPKLPPEIDKIPFETLNTTLNSIFDENEDDKVSQIQTLFKNIITCRRIILNDETKNNLLIELQQLFEEIPFIRISFLQDIRLEHREQFYNRYFDEIRPLLNKSNFRQVLGNTILTHLDNFEEAIDHAEITEWFIKLVALITRRLLEQKDIILKNEVINTEIYYHITCSLINSCIQYISEKPEIQKNEKLSLASNVILGRLYRDSTELLNQFNSIALSNSKINLEDTEISKKFKIDAEQSIRDTMTAFNLYQEDAAKKSRPYVFPIKYYVKNLSEKDKKTFLTRYFSDIRPAKEDHDFKMLLGKNIEHFLSTLIEPITPNSITEWYINLSVLCCIQLSQNQNMLIGKDLDVISKEEFNVITGSLIGICAEEYNLMHAEKLSDEMNATFISSISLINESPAAIQLRTMINTKIRDKKNPQISSKRLLKNAMKKFKPEILDTSTQAHNKSKMFSTIPAPVSQTKKIPPLHENTILKRLKTLAKVLLKLFSKPNVKVSKLTSSLGKNGKIRTDFDDVEKATDTASVKIETPKPAYEKSSMPQPTTTETTSHEIKVQPSPQYNPEKFIDGLVAAKKDKVFNKLLIHTKQDEDKKVEAFKKVEIKKGQLAKIDKEEQILDYRMQVKHNEYFEYHTRENEYIINDKGADLFEHLAAFLKHCGQTKIRISQLPPDIQNDAYNFLSKYNIEVVDYTPKNIAANAL